MHFFLLGKKKDELKDEKKDEKKRWIRKETIRGRNTRLWTCSWELASIRKQTSEEYSEIALQFSCSEIAHTKTMSQ